MASEHAVFQLFELAGNHINAFFAAAADVIEESILNAICMAETMVGRDDNTLHALPLDDVRSMLHT